MEPSQMLQIGRFPVLSGPDALELALGLVEPVAMGTVREVSLRIRTSPSTVVAVRGPVIGVEDGAGHDLYDVTVRHIDGSYAFVCGYHPRRRHCLSFIWSDSIQDVAEGSDERETNRAATWDLDRAGIVETIVHMGRLPWHSAQGLFRVGLGSRSTSVRLTSPDHPRWVYHARQGAIVVRLTGVIRRPSGELAIQFTDHRGSELHGLVDADGALQWVHLGRAWWHIERLAS